MKYRWTKDTPWCKKGYTFESEKYDPRWVGKEISVSHLYITGWLEPVDEPTNIYIDAINGSDDNDGLTPKTALASIPNLPSGKFVVNLGQEKQEPHPERWKPPHHSKYWLLTSPYAEPVCRIWKGGFNEENAYEAGNCFRTREQAEEAAAKTRKLWLSLNK